MKQANNALKTYLAENKVFAIANLYTFTYKDGTVERYTSADFDISWKGNTFLSNVIKIERGSVKVEAGFKTSEVDMTIYAGANDTIQGEGIPAFALNGRLDGCRILIERAFFGSTTGDVTPPSVTSFTLSDYALITGETANGSVVFDEIILNDAGQFAASLTAQNGTISNVTTSDNQTFSFTLTPTNGIYDITNVCKINLSLISDTNGNTGFGYANSSNYTVDTLPDYGVLAGGNTGSYSNKIDGFLFNTEANVSISATLSLARETWNGLSSPSYGIFGGGYTGSASNVIDVFDFVNKTLVSHSATLSSSRFGVYGVQNNTNGYFLGGTTGTSQTTIDKLVFGTLVRSTLSATLTNPQYYGASASSASNGYAISGIESSVTQRVQKFNFSGETATNLGNLIDSYKYQCAANNSTAAFVFGGMNSGNTRQTTIKKLTFSSDTVASVSATLPTATNGMATVTSVAHNNCYICCGSTASGNIGTVNKFDFANETISTTAISLTARSYLSSATYTTV